MESNYVTKNIIKSIEIISVGTELLLGHVLNTNTNFIAKELSQLGIPCYHHTVTGDNKKRLESVLDIAFKRNDAVILTGGLGPTQDDITLDVVSGIFGENKSNLSENCIVLPNDRGTAEGIIFQNIYTDLNGKNQGHKVAVLLPGPPREMTHMFTEYAKKYLEMKAPIKIVSSYVKLIGIGESAAEAKIIDLITNQTNPTIAPYCSLGECMFRVSYSEKKQENIDLNSNEETILNSIKKTTDKIGEILGEYIYEIGERPLSKVVFDLLNEEDLTISFAESCTAGLLTSQIADFEGASKILRGSVVTYSNDSKVELLNVNKETINKYGAVSEKVAKQMAVGVKKIFKSDIAVSITGIAGPKTDDSKKPVGLVYIGIDAFGQTKVYKYNFKGDRNKIRYLSALNALDLIRRQIIIENENN